MEMTDEEDTEGLPSGYFFYLPSSDPVECTITEDIALGDRIAFWYRLNDNSWAPVIIDHENLAYPWEWACVDACFIDVKTSYSSGDVFYYKLIPGNADLRVDDNPSGKIFLDEFGAGQKRIPFGYADQITAKKEALVGKTGVSWFSGVQTSGYKLEITNGTNTDRFITVRDRLPIPTDEKIKLDIKRIAPAQKERDPENRLTWELTVPAGKTETIIVDYTLSYPSGEELQYK